MKYQLQVDGRGVPLFDFAHTAYRHVPYAILTDVPILKEGHVPVGSVEFVHEYIRGMGLQVPMPLNVPKELEHFALPIEQASGPKILDTYKFVKSTECVKHPGNGVSKTLGPGTWQVQDVTHSAFEREYRVFVSSGFVLGVAQYTGYNGVVNTEWIHSVMRAWDSAPPVCSFDFAVDEHDVHRLVEAHHFYALGLYGWDHAAYPAMLSAWLYWWLHA